MIHFREAKKEDAEELAHFAARTFWEAFRHQNTEPDMLAHQEIMYGPHIQLKEIQDQNIHTIVGIENNQIMAYSQSRKNPCELDPHAFEIWRFYVDGSQIGKGLAHQLMEESLRKLTDLKAETIWLGVWEKNPRAIRFYQKFGFQAFSSHTYMVGDDAQTDTLMALIRKCEKK